MPGRPRRLGPASRAPASPSLESRALCARATGFRARRAPRAQAAEPSALAEAGLSPESRAVYAQGTASAPDGPSRPGRSRQLSPATLAPASPGAEFRGSVSPGDHSRARQVQAAEPGESGPSKPEPGIRGSVRSRDGSVPNKPGRPREPRPLSPASPAEASPIPESGVRAQGTASAPHRPPAGPGRRAQRPRTQRAQTQRPRTQRPRPHRAQARHPPHSHPIPPRPPYSSPTHPFAPPGPRPAKNLLMACQAAGLLSWEGRTMAAAGWHMRGDRGNAFPRWTVSRSGAARHLVTMAKTLARCSCRRDYDGSLHVTALTLADLKSHQKLHLGRPDES